MAYSNPYNGAQSNPVSQLSPLNTSHLLEGQSQLSSGHSPQFGHFTGSNGMISDSPDGKHGLKRKRSIADAAHRHTSEDSYTDDNTAQRSHSSGLNHSSGQAKGPSAASAGSQDAKKRTKTQRACDKCRTKKIRCDVLPDTDPPLCAHCKQYNYDCTFFLPIQETRFKKKRQDEDHSHQPSQPRTFAHSAPADRQEHRPEVRAYGPTSIPFLINSMATLPLPAEKTTMHPRSVWSVVSAGDGYIKVGSPSTPTSLEPSLANKGPDVRVERDIVERLINSYFTNISPILPVITKAEFVAYQPSPPPVLLYSICLMAASLRDTPRGIFEALRKTVSGFIRSEDVLSTPTLANVQALLILSMSGDCHGTQNHSLMSFAWTRTGTAIRMAQDLNLHRAEISKDGMETRRRVWATCVVVDRWYAAAFGYPQMIDLTDCDVRLPTPQDQGIGYLNALTRLSIILGEVLKAIYSPSGLFTVNDALLEDILRRLDLWKTHLPEELAFSGPDSGPAAGLLHVFYSCVCMIFWRVFMRISFICPPHVHFSLNVTEWNRVIDNTRSAIEWFDRHEIYWDSWFATSYSLVSCALCQYHTWARRKDGDAKESLLLLRDAIKRWQSTAPLTEHVGRAKTGEILTLLYEVAQSNNQNQLSNPQVLGPTVGVRERAASGVESLTWRKDPSGGYFTTPDANLVSELKELPKGIIVTEPNTPAGSHEESGRKSTGDSMFPNGARKASHDSTAGPDRSNSRNGSIPPTTAHPLSYLQPGGQTSGPPGDVGLEGVPGNMFDWGGWDNWLQSLNSDSYPGQLQGPQGPP